ncbi:class I SAM-dependent DNA methyltransferase [Sphingomonas japonica]|nr:class I SAM-dependent methyltransferase [Sphingomonas japonica]
MADRHGGSRAIRTDGFARMPDRIVSLYDRTAAAWDAARQRAGLEDAWLDQFRLGLPDGAEVLDIGCGSGVPIAEMLIERGVAMTGLDASPSLIAIAARRFAKAAWITGDMRGMALHRTFDGLIAWHSLFHLPADDQRAMFPRFALHARAGTMLLFTSGLREGVTWGEWQGEPLYHASLDSAEYAGLLAASGFEIVAHQVDDRQAGGANVWLARYAPQISPASGLDGSA